MSDYSFENSVQSAKVSALVYKTVTFMYEGQVEEGTHGYLIGTVAADENKEQAFTDWNNRMYSGFPLYWYADSELTQKIQTLLGIDDSAERLSLSEWPQPPTKQQYDDLYKLTNAKFVEIRDTDNRHVGKYAVVLNYKFWERVGYQEPHFAHVCMSAEATIPFHEIFYDNLKDAIMGGVLLSELAASFEASPDINYYYRDFIKKDLEKYGADSAKYMSLIENFNLVYTNTRISSPLQPEVMASFINEHSEVLNCLINAFEAILEKPFNIVRIESTGN